MKQREKKRFIRDLMNSIQAEMIAKIADMPEEWDGVEIRQLLADKCVRSTYPRLMTTKRRHEYEREVAVRNL